MCLIQAGTLASQSSKMLVPTIAKSIASIEVNKVKQPSPLCYPHNVSEHYRCNVLLAKDCNQGEWAIFARLLIISITAVFFK